MFDIDKTQNIKNNLNIQIAKIFSDTREGGYKTRARYQEACERFSGFLAKEFRLQKFENIKEKHITKYVDHMKAERKSPSTIKTDLSGIRFAHQRSGAKFSLPDNSKLNLEQRSIGKIDKAWTSSEIKMAKDYAKITGREDVYHAINLSSNIGYRIEGVTIATVRYLENSLKYGELYIKEKGGLERYVPITRENQMNAIKEVLAYARNQGKTGHEKVLVSNVKGGVQRQIKSIQNWIGNNQKHFRDDSLRGKQKTEEFKKIAEKNGFKLRSSNISFHGLRYHYAQTRFEELRKQGNNDNMAKKITAENMGHHRPDVTNIYLSA